MLASALAKPIQHWHYDDEDDAVSLAVTLLFGIARNHPFQQGNKRTGFEAAIIFLEMNGYTLTVADSPLVAQFIVAVIAHKFSEAEFEAAIRPFVEPLGDDPDC